MGYADVSFIVSSFVVYFFFLVIVVNIGTLPKCVEKTIGPSVALSDAQRYSVRQRRLNIIRKS
jgi:hypothetical protein